jgi:thiol-disulfide isomerase/thioredoxin
VLGTVLILTALAMLTNLDVNFDQFVAQHIPNVNLTASLECSPTVTRRLHQITGRQPKFAPANGSAACGSSATAVHPAAANASQAILLSDAHELKALGEAPEFMETQDWFNTPGGRPLTLSSLRGRVVLVDFWTYTCINCIRTLPYLKAWSAAYGGHGLTIVGVETPEFAFERDAANVANAISQFGLRYPVVQDNDMGTWNAYGNQYWPADYLIDANGQVRYTSFGEGDYSQTETAIRALLAEAGYQVGAKSHPTGVVVPSQETTPETYLGTERAQGWANGPKPGLHDYGATPAADLELNEFAYSGTWNIGGQPAKAIANAGIDVEFQAKNVYLVLSSAGERAAGVRVLLDGREIPAADSGADVHGGVVTVRRQRLYSLVSLAHNERHRLSLRFAPGVTGYAFTFG